MFLVLELTDGVNLYLRPVREKGEHCSACSISVQQHPGGVIQQPLSSLSVQQHPGCVSTSPLSPFSNIQAASPSSPFPPSPFSNIQAPHPAAPLLHFRLATFRRRHPAAPLLHLSSATSRRRHPAVLSHRSSNIQAASPSSPTLLSPLHKVVFTNNSLWAQYMLLLCPHQSSTKVLSFCSR